LATESIKPGWVPCKLSAWQDGTLLCAWPSFCAPAYSDENKALRGNTSVADFAHHQLANKVLVQGQAAQFLQPDDPFPYLGVHITMDLNWTHQLTHMTTKLSLKLERLKNSFASPIQTMDIIRTAIVPSIAHSFPVTPCSLNVLNQWDTQTLAAIKSKYKLWMCISTALL